jgi:iron complex outermembrane recepter protein
VTGSLGKYGITSPWATDGVGINAGAEYRKETVTFNPDAAELQGNLAGFSGASVPTDASYHVGEAFFEARAPLAQHLPGIYDLTIDAGYRYSNYNTVGITNTYKFEVQFAPVPDARLRFSFDRAVRAPNLIELFNAPSIGQEQQVGTDPCAPTIVNGAVVAPTASFAQCARTGVTGTQYYGPNYNPNNPAANDPLNNTITQCVSGQCSEVIEGNSRLQPEVATTWSLGVTLTPTALPNFTASLDYYHIRLTGEVGSVPIGVILDGCLQTGNSADCSQIVRSSTGSLTGASVGGGGYFLQQEMNLGVSVVSGIDVNSNYHWQLPTGWGGLTASLNGTWVQHNTTTPYPGGATYDCAGLFGATCDTGSVNPKWRHNLRVTWETPWSVLLSAQWRYIGPSDFDNNSTSPLLQNVEEGEYDPLNARIPGYNYIDLAAVWQVGHGMELRGGVNNVLDKDPPFLPLYEITGSQGAANTFGTYDILGREFFFAFTAKF